MPYEVGIVWGDHTILSDFRMEIWITIGREKRIRYGVIVRSRNDCDFEAFHSSLLVIMPKELAVVRGGYCRSRA